jgi:hypothetical protein
MPKLKSGYSKKPVARSILTETMPYEVPLYFTNFHLYERLSSGQTCNSLVEKIIGLRGETVPCKACIVKRPFGTRELGIMHPSSQAQVAEFYQNYDGFIAQLCGRSTLSLRFPLRPASRYFDSRYSDRSKNDEIDLDDVGFEVQAEFSSSYFAYRRYAQVYKFFDSQEFLDLEQKYRFLLRVDVSKCFSSIYTHSISWAVRGKVFGKKMKSKSKISYFEDDFDALMRNMNWGETNGILVGPEVSRIFCEMILQGADVSIQSRLPDDVCVRRYMDDYFIFGRDPESCAIAERVISDEIAQFNLHLNENKRELAMSPLVTSLSVARLRMNEFSSALVETFRNSLRRRESSVAEESGPAPGVPEASGAATEQVTMNAERAIRGIRAIAKQYGVEYSGLAAPALAVIAHRLNSVCYSLKPGAVKLEIGAIAEIQSCLGVVLRVAEFLYISDVRSSTSNKISRIFLEVSDICSRLGVGRSFVELQMLDTVRKSLSVWRESSLLDVINAVVSVQVIASAGRGLTRDDIQNVLDRRADDSTHGVSYLRSIAGIFLCANRPRLAVMSQRIASETAVLLQTVNSNKLADSSFCMLLLDYFACPHIAIDQRAELYRSVSRQLFAEKGISLGDAKGAVKKISHGVRFTDWSVSQGSLSGLRRLLQKTELRLAYD